MRFCGLPVTGFFRSLLGAVAISCAAAPQQRGSRRNGNRPYTVFRPTGCRFPLASVKSWLQSSLSRPPTL